MVCGMQHGVCERHEVMNAGVQQIVNGAPALPAQGDSPTRGGAGVKGLLDSVMQKAVPPGQPELPQPPVNRSPDKSEQHRKGPRAETNLQTPAMVVVVTGAPILPVPVTIPGQTAEVGMALENGAQRSGRASPVPGDLPAGLVPPGAAASVQPDGGAPGSASQPLPSQSGVRGSPADAKDFRNEVSPTPAPPQSVGTPARQVPELIAGGVLPTNLQWPAAGAGNEQSAIQAESPGRGISEESGAMPAMSGVDASQEAEQHETVLKNAPAGMENRHFDPVAGSVKGNAAPLPTEPRDANSLSFHAQVEERAAVAANHQKQETGGSRDYGKNGEAPNTRAEQEHRAAFAIDKAESGPPRDPAGGVKSGQDAASRRADPAGPQGSRAGAAPGNSVTATGVAAASTEFVAQDQVQPSRANAAPQSAPVLHPSGPLHGATAGMPAAENPADRAGFVTGAAAILQSHGKAEMRIALQTESLGPLELHAVLDGGRLGASISVLNHEAHTLLTNSLPSLQQVLTDRDLRVERLSVLNAAPGGTNTGNGGGFHSGGQTHPRPNAPAWVFIRPPTHRAEDRESVTAETLRGRLSVHA